MKTTLQKSVSFTGFLILFIILYFNSLRAQSEWHSQISGTTADLNSVFFINSLTGYAAGVNKIIKTTDGGINWKPKDYTAPMNDEYIFKSVCFTNSMTGWIAGDMYRIRPGRYYRIILKTTNGGENWEESYFYQNGRLNSVCHKFSDAGWIAGYNVILKSTNQGLNWIEQDFPKGENDDITFNSICFNNLSTGWIAGDVYTNPPGIHQKIIFKTENGGATWVEKYRSGETGLKSVSFCSSLNGWTVSNSEIQKSNNGGLNWITQAIFGGHNNHYYLNSVFFLDEWNGYVAGGSVSTFGPEYSNVLLKTTNGGINWAEKLIPANENNYKLNSVFFINDTTGWTVGNGGIILKKGTECSTDIKSKSIDNPNAYSLEQNYPNPFNSVTSIKFKVTSIGNSNQKSEVRLTVLDLLGREVATLVNKKLLPGVYEIFFDARLGGSSTDLPSGVYFYKLTTDNFTDTKKLILIK